MIIFDKRLGAPLTQAFVIKTGKPVARPRGAIIEVVWESHASPHPRPVERIGLTPIPALKVKPPLIEECKAHLECIYIQHLTFGQEVILLGEIVAACADRLAVEARDPYAYLRLITFLEDGTYGVIEQSQRIRSKNNGE
jgi:flavin reductase (DIM6/NTAB) family NADH-FMN oxidoreductase RutF